MNGTLFVGSAGGAAKVAMLVDEAADAAMQGIATPAAIDLAMQKGVNYPRGPLAWGDAVGAARIAAVLANLAAHYGEDRYRTSPRLARAAQAGGRQVRHDERAVDAAVDEGGALEFAVEPLAPLAESQSRRHGGEFLAPRAQQLDQGRSCLVASKSVQSA